MFFQKFLIKSFFIAGFFSLFSFSAHADDFIITFNEAGLQSPTASDNRGTIIDNEYGSDNVINLGSLDVTFWAQKHYSPGTLDSSNADLFLTLFNSNATFATADNDLKVGQGNLVVIQEHSDNCSLTDNLCANPDDRANGSSPKGGYIFAEFSQPISMHSIGFADIEDGYDNETIAFLDDAGTLIGNWRNMEMTGDNGYKVKHFGDSQINSGDRISYMILKMKTSGGFDDMKFSTTAKIPEPSSIVLFALALLLNMRNKRLIRLRNKL